MLVDLLARQVHERAEVELGLAVGRNGVGDAELGGPKLDLDPVQISLRSVAVVEKVLIASVEVLEPFDTDLRVANHLPGRQRPEHVGVVDIVDPLPHRFLVLGLQHLFGGARQPRCEPGAGGRCRAGRSRSYRIARDRRQLAG